MKREIPDTYQKALRINLDPEKYGTFAEIGAGQEVARAFFRVGGAAGTVAKTMSAYDMTFSDAIYGSSERYVSRQRLQTMLDHEYHLLLERLSGKRGSQTNFFAFADTVTARSYTRQVEAHGWMGIKFQTKPQAEPSQIILHMRMLDRENVQQQEALGILGVNLIYAAFYFFQQPQVLLSSLLDNLSAARIEVDMIKFHGPDFDQVDNRLMSLELVQKELTPAAMFTAQGEVVQPGEALYNHSILVERGAFRPVNLLHMDMLRCARAQFFQDSPDPSQDALILMEITTRNLLNAASIDPADFLARADLLGALGCNVLISSYSRFYPLAAYLGRYTRKRIGITMGVPTLRELFNEKYYSDLEGGILESFGRLFKNDLKLYIYPNLEPNGDLIQADQVLVASHLRHLYLYLLENHNIESLLGFDQHLLFIRPKEVLEAIQSGNPAWEQLVPPVVAQMIKDRHYFGWGRAPLSQLAVEADAGKSDIPS